MRRILLILALVLMASCSITGKYMVSSDAVDLKKYTEKDFLISAGWVDNCEPVALISVNCIDGKLDEKKDTIQIAGGGQYIASYHKKATIGDAIAEAFEKSVKAGADALIDVNVRADNKGVYLTGYAVKRR